MPEEDGQQVILTARGGEKVSLPVPSWVVVQRQILPCVVCQWCYTEHWFTKSFTLSEDESLLCLGCSRTLHTAISGKTTIFPGHAFLAGNGIIAISQPSAPEITG